MNCRLPSIRFLISLSILIIKNKATKKTRQLFVLRWFPLSSLCSFFVGVVAVFVVLFVVGGGVFRDTKSVILCHFGQNKNIRNLFVRLS